MQPDSEHQQLIAEIAVLQNRAARLRAEIVDHSLTRDAFEISRIDSKGGVDLDKAARSLLDRGLKDIVERETEVLLREKRFERDLAAWEDLRLPPDKRRRSVTAERVWRLRSKLRDAKRTIRSIQGAVETLERTLAWLRPELESAKSEIEATNERARKLESQVRVSRREQSRLAKQINDASGGLLAHCPAARRWMAELDGTGDGLEWSDSVAILGSGPFDKELINHALIQYDFEGVAHGNRDAGILIVGRENCPKKHVIEQIEARAGHSLKIYSQEMALVALFTLHDPFDAGEDVLLEIGRNHPVLAWLIEGIKDDRKWPWHITTSDGWFDEEQELIPLPYGDSPLAVMGYTVGIHFGLSPKQRHEILMKAFSSDIPDATCRDQIDEYMEQWGMPGSSQRLWRIARHIAGQVYLKRPNPVMDVAVAEWEEDLQWLRRALYPRVRFKFRWPRRFD